MAQLLREIFSGCIAGNLIVLHSLSRADQCEVGESIGVFLAANKIFGKGTLTIVRELGQAFVDWLISAEGQAAIAGYRIDGQQLFFPDAEKKGS